MSESTQEYHELYNEVQAAGEVARLLVIGASRSLRLPKLFASERAALAGRARETARWHAHLAEVLELEER